MTDSRRKTGYVVIANEIWEEVICRGFSKRQKDILFFIWRLSYGCNRKTALIPRQKDFELCGVGKTNIANELKSLEECKVIFWNRINNRFSLNENFDEWQISPVRGWDDDKFEQLLQLNQNSLMHDGEEAFYILEDSERDLTIFAQVHKKRR